MEYVNYHKHTHKSNVRAIDCIVKPIEYIERAKELGHSCYSVVEHGWAGNYIEDYELCANNDLKMIFGAELYIVKDRFEKDSSNHHIILISKNKEGFKQLNKVISESNKTGFYYKNRIDLNLIEALDPNLFFCTSACVGGILNDMNIFTFVKDYFKQNFYLETQSHNHEYQVKFNKAILELSNKYDIQLIHANDSHYIYPEQAKDRDLFLKGKNIRYEMEDGFMLDYPSYEEIQERYYKQGVLNGEDVKQALNNTLIFKNCENLYFSKEVKMPNPFKGQDTKRMFKQIVVDKWNKEKSNIPKEKHLKYMNSIVDECKIVLETNMENYFLINERIVDKAVNVYGGILTRTGRGSAVGFYINKLLGFTEIDRLDADVPLYPTRFMSKSRILETKSLPDLDFNTSSPLPFIKASKDVLGEDNVYYMLALGTMQESEAFRNLCRAYDLDMNEYNEIGKDLKKYEKDPKWGKIIEESKKYIGVIDSVSPSPCAFLLLEKPISEEIGIIKVNGELCASLDGYTADKWNFLKNDFLTVSVWKIISNTFKKIGKPIPNIRELKSKLDDKIWNLYSDGITATLNQVGSNSATSFMKRYKAKTVAELTAFVAAIRPAFGSLLDNFLDRRQYSTGVPEVDEILADSFHYILYQESIMKFLTWCDVPEDETYTILKKIAKKKFPVEELNKLKGNLFESFSSKVSEPERFNDIWQVIEDAVRYSFNSAHALSVALDSLYGAYLKANYTLEYYSVVLDHYIDNTTMTGKLIKELPYFNIKLSNIRFRKSIDKYTFDKTTNTIYKGIESIKFCNSTIALELYELKNEKFSSFIELLIRLKSLSINKRQIEILTIFNYFSEFGKNKKLLDTLEIFNKFHERKQLKKQEIEEENIPIEIVKRFSKNETPKLFKEIDIEGLITELCSNIENKNLNIREQLSKEMEYMEYLITTVPSIEDNKLYFIKDYKTYKNKYKPYITLYNIATGEEIKTKVTDTESFMDNPFKKNDIIEVNEFKESKKNKKIDGRWVKINEYELILSEWSLLIDTNYQILEDDFLM